MYATRIVPPTCIRICVFNNNKTNKVMLFDIQSKIFRARFSRFGGNQRQHPQILLTNPAAFPPNPEKRHIC